ncbi:hypothetical protein L6654_37790 [Bradyrhizobium sp. WYCCWR 13023]|uniref:Type II secretion system protein GspC N-terminal domain-containing protein n=1 Tax=Bradyrhizobium zhengyangense TaxID=2911009 RepID=A0A9X1UBN7_9BRAD|nr:hypothetical protein [Bradyrhizobium zhengyangense]MCG2632370.1 hypothetical protein [Bradyrhizobium zhengyangense]
MNPLRLARPARRIMMTLPSTAPRWFSPVKNLVQQAIAMCTFRLLGRSGLPTLQELVGLRGPVRVLVAGLSIWIGLVGFVLIAAMVWVELSTISLPAWLRSTGVRGRNAESRVSQDFSNIMQRPLFLRSRQVVEPPPEAPTSPPITPAGPDMSIVLRGVFINGDVAKAFLISSSNPAGIWAQTNEEVAGWRVMEIQPGQVLLGGYGQHMAVQYSPSAGK